MPINRLRQRPTPKGPITLVGSPTEAGGAAADNGDSFTLTLPTGLLIDDVVYVFSVYGTTAGGSLVADGWTQIAEVDNTHRSRVYRKVMGPVPDTEVVIAGSGSASDGGAAVAHALRGVNRWTPEDTTPTTATGSSTNPDPPSITTLTNKAWVFAFAASRTADGSVTAPTGYANQVDVSTGESNAAMAAGATKEVTAAGAEDPAAWTSWTTGLWATVSVAVRPASA